MMNYLHIANKGEAKFTYERFSIKKVSKYCIIFILQGESLVLQPTDPIFASYSFLVELKVFIKKSASDDRQNIHDALSSYTTLTNNSRIVLNVDGQKYSVIVRLLKPEDKVRVTSNMNVVISKKVYVFVFGFGEGQNKHVKEVVNDNYEDMQDDCLVA